MNAWQFVHYSTLQNDTYWLVRATCLTCGNARNRLREATCSGIGMSREFAQ